MPTFIKAGYWEKITKGYNSWFNIDKFVDDKDNAVKEYVDAGDESIIEYVDSRPSGGVKSFFFTKIASDIEGYYNAETTLPNNEIQTIPLSVGNGETLIAQFLTPLGTPDYRVTEGTRLFYITARASSIAKKIQLRGEVWLTDLNGENQTLLRRSSLSDILTLVDVHYITSVYGNTVFIDHSSTRVVFKIIAIKEAGGPNITVTISVDDDTYSRLDVPSPIGVTEMIIKDDNNLPTINNVGKLRYTTTANSSEFDICMQTGVGIYEWVTIKQNLW